MRLRERAARCGWRPRRPRRRPAPRSRTGANMAARVPTTARTAPRRTASHSRYRFSGPASAVSSACRPSPSRPPSAASTRADGRPSGTTTSAPRPEASVAARPARAPRPTPARAARSTRRGAHPRRPAPRGTPPPRSYRAQRPGLGRDRRRRQRRGQGRGLGPGVPRRNGQLQHVREAPRVPVGDGPRQPQQLRAQHRLGRDDLRERGQRPGVVGLGDPLDEEPVDQPAALAPPFPHLRPPGPEPHPDPDPGLGVGVQLLRHRVVEVPVEMQHALVDQHPRDRQLLRQRGPPPGPRLGPRRLGLPHRLPDERELLRHRVPRRAAAPRARPRCSRLHSYQTPLTTDAARDPGTATASLGHERRGPASPRDAGPRRRSRGAAGLTAPRPCAAPRPGPCAPR